MKHLLYIFLFCCSWGYGQVKMSADEQEILCLEVNRLKDVFVNKYPDKAVTGDSIVIDIKVLHHHKPNSTYTTLATDGDLLSKEEAIEVFGEDNNQLFVVSDKEIDAKWSKESFPKNKVFLFDDIKHSSAYASVKDKEPKMRIGTYSILSITKPIVREDGKYAIVETSSEHHGGVLSIYKKIKRKWIFYKNLQLYLI